MADTERTYDYLINAYRDAAPAFSSTRQLHRDEIKSHHYYPTLAGETGVVSERYPYGDVRRFGAVDGSDNTTAIQAAFTAASEGSTISFAGIDHTISSPITRSGIARLRISGYGAKLVPSSISLVSAIHLTSCDQLLIEGFDSDGGETFGSFSADAPTDVREIFLLTTCAQPTVRNITGRNKRRFVFFDTCTEPLIVNSQFTGFFQDVASGAQANANNCPAVTFSACSGHIAANVQADHVGAVILNALDSHHYAFSQIIGRECHDSVVYGSSGYHGSISQVGAKNVVNSGVKARGHDITVAGADCDNCGEAAILLTGNGATPDDLGANGYNLSVLGGVANGCFIGVLVKDQDGLYPRDVSIIGFEAYDTKGTGNNAPINATVVRAVKIRDCIIRKFAADFGILVGGLVSAIAPEVDVSGNTVADGNGSAASTKGAIRLQFVTEYLCGHNTISDIASNIGVRLNNASKGRILGNGFDGQRVVSCPTAENNTDNYIAGNRGATMVVDGDNNDVGDNKITGSITTAAASPAQITADQNDYSPSVNRTWRLNSDASRIITGIAARPITLTIINTGAQNITLKNQSTASASGNRIITGTGADVVLAPDDTAVLLYDGASVRWRILNTY